MEIDEVQVVPTDVKPEVVDTMNYSSIGGNTEENKINNDSEMYESQSSPNVKLMK